MINHSCLMRTEQSRPRCFCGTWSEAILLSGKSCSTQEISDMSCPCSSHCWVLKANHMRIGSKALVVAICLLFFRKQRCWFLLNRVLKSSEVIVLLWTWGWWVGIKWDLPWKEKIFPPSITSNWDRLKNRMQDQVPPRVGKFSFQPICLMFYFFFQPQYPHSTHS